MSYSAAHVEVKSWLQYNGILQTGKMLYSFGRIEKLSLLSSHTALFERGIYQEPEGSYSDQLRRVKEVERISLNLLVSYSDAIHDPRIDQW